jgi:hypothetical protein
VVAVLLPGPQVKPNHHVIALPRSQQQNLAAKNNDYSTVHKRDRVYFPMTCLIQRRYFPVLFEPGLALSLFPCQFLDANDCHLDFMSAMTTTCIGGEIFSRVHTFRISADCKVLPQEQEETDVEND